jgi:hypothetical protein
MNLVSACMLLRNTSADLITEARKGGRKLPLFSHLSYSVAPFMFVFFSHDFQYDVYFRSYSHFSTS